MSILEEIILQAKLMSNGLQEEEYPLLEAACRAAEINLSSNLREYFTPENIRKDFVSGAALMALATLSDFAAFRGVEQFTAGDVTIRTGSKAAVNCLRLQAQVLMAPYMRPGVPFMGV